MPFQESNPGDPITFNSVVSDNEATIISGSAPEDIQFTNTELRHRLGIPSDDRMDNYQDLHAIGLGGVGAVYSGNEPGTNREVAIKILRPQYRYSTQRIESFVREARTTALIDHPNVIPVYRFGVFDNEGVYFSMKRVRGETLRNVLRKLAENRRGYSRKYTLRRLINIFISACNGVAFANKNGILHGDLKPGNIMIGEFGEILVMDWGMACYRPDLDTFEGREKDRLDNQEELRHPQDNTLSTDAPAIGGTPVFMAPEHLTGEEKKLTEASEVYSLGTILYSILTWKAAPFDTNLPREQIIRQVIRGRFQAPRKAAPRCQPVPRELEAVCRKAMSKDPKKRYQHVSEMIDDLQNYLDGYPVRAYSPSPFYRLGKWFSRHPIIPMTVLTSVLGIGGFYVYHGIQQEAEMRSRFRLAQYNASLAATQFAAARSNYRKLKSGHNLEYNERYILFRNVSKWTALMSNSNATALASLSQLPSHALNKKNTLRLQLAGEIFRRAITLYLELGDAAQLQDAVENYRRRWGKLFFEVLQNDPELLRLISGSESHKGSLKLNLPSGWSAEIKTADGKSVSKMHRGNVNLQLPTQKYLIVFRHKATGEFTFPVRIQSGKSTRIQPGYPKYLPDGLCYIGGGEIPVLDLLHSRSGEETQPFLISKHEVSIREYLRFWKSLPPAQRRQHQPISSISATGMAEPLWDAKGRLRKPYSPDLPVTGISSRSASAYCRWLGRRMNRTVRLPNAAEWEKAAFRFPAQETGQGIFYSESTVKLFPAGAPVGTYARDISVFGVVNMRGNVRELLADFRGRATLVTGGSFMSPESDNRQQMQMTASGDNDIGFRYVVEIPERNIIDQ